MFDWIENFGRDILEFLIEQIMHVSSIIPYPIIIVHCSLILENFTCVIYLAVVCVLHLNRVKISIREDIREKTDILAQQGKIWYPVCVPHGAANQSAAYEMDM